MATAYQLIQVMVAKHVNALAGATASSQSSNFAISPATTTTIDDAVFTVDLLKHTIIDTHGAIVLAIASAVDPVTKLGNHPWRGFFRDLTANLAHGANWPTTGTGGKSIIGNIGGVFDSSDTDQVLMRASLERVSKYKNNSAIYTNNPWLWAESGGKIWHTTTNVTLDVCVYERSDAVTAFAAGNISIPDSLAWALVAGSVAQIVVSGENLDQATAFAAYYAAALNEIAKGSVNMPGLPVGLREAA